MTSADDTSVLLGHNFGELTRDYCSQAGYSTQHIRDHLHYTIKSHLSQLNYSVLGKQRTLVTLFVNIIISNYFKDISFGFKYLHDGKFSDYASIAGLTKCYPLVSIKALSHSKVSALHLAKQG